MARKDVQLVEVDRTVLGELLDLASRASRELCFADAALSDGLKWAVSTLESDLVQHA